MSFVTKMLQRASLLPKLPPKSNGHEEKAAVIAAIRQAAVNRQVLRKEIGLDSTTEDHLDSPCGPRGGTYHPHPA